MDASDNPVKGNQQSPQNNNQQMPPIESFIPGQQQQPQQPQQQPQQPQQPQAQQAQPNQQAQTKRGSKKALYIGIATIALVIIGVAIIFEMPHHVTTTSITTSIPATTIKQPTMAMITGCMNITQPGTYYLSKDINVNLASGSCIDIKSNNVRLIGNSNILKGSGPFVGVPPFTYGIMAKNVDNITITGFNITQFSFGIYFENVKDSTISNCNATKNVMANIFLNGSSSNNVENTLASFSSSTYGSINIEGGGDNTFLNDTIYGNAHYGFYVNSTGNKFIRDTLNNNPQDFVCYGSAGFSSSNLFSDVACRNNLYCNFAWCSVSNMPLNMSTISLSSNITTCGSINQPGIYTLSSNLSATQYMNMSNPTFKTIPCITLNQPNIVLNCNGHAIENGGYAISASSPANYNQTIENCILKNNTVGLYLNGVFYPKINNVKVFNNTYGVSINNLNSGTAFNITGSGNKYGVFVNNTNSFTLSNFSFVNNNYGLYVNTGGSNIYNKGTLNGNKYGDLYCTALSYNVSPSMFTGVACNLTDCNWGVSCSRHALPPISVYPLNNCTTITVPGNYSLAGNIKAKPNCFVIKTSNVSLNCNNVLIAGNNAGNAFIVSNVSNVAISNCRVKNFGTGILASNTQYLTLQNIGISNVGSGILLSNSSYSKVLNVNLTTFYKTGYLIDNVLRSIISNDYAYDGTNGSAFVISNSTSDLITFNNATSNAGYGFLIENSNNNNIFNNSAYSNKIDYACSQSSSGIYDEVEGVNFGGTKNDCHWLVELNSQSLGLTPLSLSTSSTIILSQDILYRYGDIFYNIYNTKSSSANNTLINCNYHTIYALNGGTFVNVANASNVKIENCYIKNFTYAIKGGGGSYLQAINNTIVNSNIAVTQSGGAYPKLINNTILNASYGLLLVNTNYGTIEKNNIANTNISIQLAGGSGYQISNNKANYGNKGLYMGNSTIDILQGNSFLNMSKYGVICTGLATNSTSLNKDNGNNVCSSNYMCYWLTNSPMCKV